MIIRKLLEILKKLEPADLKFLLMFVLGTIPAFILRLRHKDIWLICERYNSAEDNGWIFYQWVKKHHPEQIIFFILGKVGKAAKETIYGKDDHIVRWGSFRHVVLYIAAQNLIKTMFTPPVPSLRSSYYYEKFTGRKRARIYLRHGISASGVEHHLYELHKARLFICGAKPEYDYISQNAGYPEGYVQYTGFARFDDLLEHQTDGRFVLIMPTWRRYIDKYEKTPQENEELFLQSTYYKYIQSLLSNKALVDFIESTGHKVKFCMHAQFRRYLHLFKDIDPRIEVIGDNVTVHELLMSTSLLITDYSSVFFDVAYMKKPMVFYQFDYEEFREKHFSEGYFSFKHDGMGPVVETEEALLEAIKKIFDGEKFTNTDFYLQRCDKFFPIHDNHNCERIYNAIVKIREK